MLTAAQMQRVNEEVTVGAAEGVYRVVADVVQRPVHDGDHPAGLTVADANARANTQTKIVLPILATH